MVHVWLETSCLGTGWLAAGWKSAAWVEGVGAMGVAGMLEVEEWLVDLVEKLGGHIWLSAQSLEIMVNVAETGVMPAEIMMVSISFKVQFFKLIIVFLFNFVMPVLFYFVYKGPASI